MSCGRETAGHALPFPCAPEIEKAFPEVSHSGDHMQRVEKGSGKVAGKERAVEDAEVRTAVVGAGFRGAASHAGGDAFLLFELGMLNEPADDRGVEHGA